MGHKILVSDVVVIQREVELPDRCPRCGTKFKLGDACIDSKQLRTTQERLRLTRATSGRTKTDTVEVKKVTPMPSDYPRVCRELCCARCNYILKATALRQYDLRKMEKREREKLQGLLYDANVLDDYVRTMVFGGT